MTMKRPCIKQTSSPDSSAETLISVGKTCWLKLSLRRERFHVAGVPLAVEVKNFVISGTGRVLGKKEQKVKSEQYRQQPQYRRKQEEKGSLAKFSHFYALTNLKETK